jgi:ParB family transcriptional regulator, chromosome partitioning protein
MLGKGLESLIPPKKSDDSLDTSNSTPSTASPVLIGEEQAQAQAQQPQAQTQAPRESEEVVMAEPVRREVVVEPARPLAKRGFEGNAIFHIEVDKISPNPNQPRRDFNEESIKDLASSIREFGILQPLVVTKIEKETETGTSVEYQLIAGERRLMAAKTLGLHTVPVVVKRIEAPREGFEMAIIENLQRENLNPIETARAFAKLQDQFRLTQREIATQLGKSRETIANTVRLLDLPSHMQDAIASGQMSESHGRLLLAIDEESTREAIFRDLVDKHLTTRELKIRVEATKPNRKPVVAVVNVELSSELKMLQEKLTSELGAPVKVEAKGDPPAGGGKITITFYSQEELNNIVSKLGGGEEV